MDSIFLMELGLLRDLRLIELFTEEHVHFHLKKKSANYNIPNRSVYNYMKFNQKQIYFS